MTFEEANQTEHPVETQWHYPIMSAAGFEALTKTGTGFVRGYVYKHPVTQKQIRAVTGVNADYWEDQDTSQGGYWSTLEAHVKKLTAE